MPGWEGDWGKSVWVIISDSTCEGRLYTGFWNYKDAKRVFNSGFIIGEREGRPIYRYYHSLFKDMVLK